MKACVEIRADSCLVGPNHDNRLISDLVFHEVTDIGDLLLPTCNLPNTSPQPFCLQGGELRRDKRLLRHQRLSRDRRLFPPFQNLRHVYASSSIKSAPGDFQSSAEVFLRGCSIVHFGVKAAGPLDEPGFLTRAVASHNVGLAGSAGERRRPPSPRGGDESVPSAPTPMITTELGYVLTRR